MVLAPIVRLLELAKVPLVDIGLMSRARAALSMVRLRVLVVARAILLLQNIGISKILSRQNSNDDGNNDDDGDNDDERNKELNKRGCSADGRSEKPSALEHRLLFLLFAEYNPTSIYLSICLVLPSVPYLLQKWHRKGCSITIYDLIVNNLLDLTVPSLATDYFNKNQS